MGIKLSKGSPCPAHQQPGHAPDAGPSSAPEDPYPVLDLPTDVLHYFLASITDPEQLRRLSLVNNRASVVVRLLHKPLRLQLPCSDPQKAAEELCAEAAESQCKRLRICGTWDDEAEWELRNEMRDPADPAGPLELLTQPAVQAALHRITTVELMGFRCSTLVPDGLHLIGPQVTHLSIEDCYVAQLSGQPTPCPNIRSLHVSQLIDSYDAHDDADIMQSAIIAQLSALPGLQELVWEWRPNALLHLIHGFPEEGLWAAVPKLLPTHTLNTLTKLDFPWVALCNEDIETLLGMSVLRDIGFGSLRVTQDYSQRGCQWEQLSCSQLQPDQLARLPLQSVQSLRLRCQGVDDYMMRPDGYRGMQLWVQGALADPGATAAAAAAISRIPRLTVVPSDELQHSENAEVIIILQGQPETEDMVDHLASLELLWATLARGFAHTSHVITLQLHTQYLFCPTFVEGTTKLLLRASPGSVLPRLRLELFQCSFESLTVSERLLHVTAGLPLVVTLHPESVEHVYTALAHAPRHGPSKRLTVQLCCQYNRHNLCRPERKLPKAAGKAGYEIELVYLHGKAKVDAFGALMWRSATGVYRAVEFLTTHNHPVP